MFLIYGPRLWIPEGYSHTNPPHELDSLLDIIYYYYEENIEMVHTMDMYIDGA